MKRYFTFLLLYIAMCGLHAFAQSPNLVFTVTPSQEVYETDDTFAESVFLSLGLVNENVSIKGVQFKLDPVKGFDANGYPKAKLGERVPTRGKLTDLESGGWACMHSASSPVFLLNGQSELRGTEGEILRIELLIDKQQPSGVYPITFREIKISDENGTIIKYIDKITVNVTIKSWDATNFLGNAHNADKVLDVKDPNDAAAMILGRMTPNKEIDVNWDGNCTIGDLVRIIDMTKNQK